MKLLPYVASLIRILNHSIWINITQLMTQKQELLQNRGQNLYLTFNLKFKGLMIGFSSWLLLDIRRASLGLLLQLESSSSKFFRPTYGQNTLKGSRGKLDSTSLGHTHTHTHTCHLHKTGLLQFRFHQTHLSSNLGLG